MNIPDLQLINKINKLTVSNKSFAIYRLPWTETPLFVMQKDDNTDTYSSLCELNDKKGFIISPFQATEKHPIIIIRPDIIANGWSEIEHKLNSIEFAEINDISSENDEYKEESELKEKYTSVFNKFIKPLKNNEFQKLVLSRKAKYVLEENFSPTEAFIKACNSYPRMMISLTHTPISGTWIGSTPEIIISGKGNNWNTVSLAGTMQMNGADMPENWSEKNKEEQALVSEYIIDILKDISNSVTANGPYTVQAGPLAHLKTDFKFTLDDNSKLGSVIDALYPTPAICGLPKHGSYNFIIQNEGYDRGYYSGIIGWLNPEGETNLYVNLRCANITVNSATYYAGGGILPLSEASSEWDETQHKINTMRRCLTNIL